MINEREVAAFFDRLAPGWEAGTVRNERVIASILDAARVSSGKSILDVACGCGVLIPDYLARGAAHVTGIDLSPKMAQIARAKFEGDRRVSILTGNAELVHFGRTYDCIVVYNALPHFADPARLIAALSKALSPGGTLTVAHGMSRARINEHHRDVPEDVSSPLPPAEELAAVFARYLTVKTAVSDDEKYYVVGEL